jgi:hypothetical protein
MAQPAPAAQATNTGGVTKEDLKRIGRINGPDLQLKFDPATVLDFNTTNNNISTIIREDSSITEVLNILSFLISNGGRTFAEMVDTDNSAYDGSANGSIDAATGYYADPVAQAANFEAATFSLETLDVTAPAGDIHFPVSILKRRGAAGANDDPDSFADDIGTKLINANTANAEVKALFSDCVKQMINLLTQTRLILGPKGWTDLFSKVKGGSKHSKKTKHRRRKYSSNQH